MIIFIDGYQGTGKSTLINNCKFKHNRFPFNQYLDEFNLNLNTLQITKDLAMLFGLQYTKEDVVFDRGPLSTIFYSLKENRYGNDTTIILTKFVSELKKYPNCKFVWVKKINGNNSIERKHNDGFDYLDDENDPEKDKILDEIIKVFKTMDIEIYIFENDFSKKLKQNYHNFNKLLEELTNEYNRN